MKTIVHQQQFLALRAAHDRSPEITLARGRVGLYARPPQGALRLDPQEFLGKVQALQEEINAQLIDMQESVAVCLAALLAGENVFLISLPGAAKSTLARLVAEAINGQFFRVVLNPDISRNDLIGSLDPQAIQQGRWQRKLSGIATASVALLDEFFKSSGVVRNMLLDALEEHRVAQPDGDSHIPLLLGIAASNEIVDASAKNAVWDRMLFRLKVNYPHADEDWLQLLGSDSGRRGIATRLDPEEIMLFQALVELRARELARPIQQAMNKVRKEWVRKGGVVSPRRFLGWARAIVAAALLEGSDAIQPRHLMVGQYILWTDLEDIPAVVQIVGGISDPERALLLSVAADIEQLENQADSLENLQALAKFRAQLTKLGAKLERGIHSSQHAERRGALLAAIAKLQDEGVEKAIALAAAK